MMNATAPRAYHVILGWKQTEATSSEMPACSGGDAPTPTDVRSQIRVLIVDDEPVILTALEEVLSDYGFNVVGVAADGGEGVEKAEALLPDVVIMDVRMRAMDGIEATRQIRRAVPNVQVIVLSAYDDRSLRQAAHAAGAHAYLLKGVAVDHIERAIVEAARAPKRLCDGPGAWADQAGGSAAPSDLT